MGIKHSVKYVMVALCALSLVPTVAMGTVFLSQSNINAQAGCAGNLDLNGTAVGAQTEVLFGASGVVTALFNAECAVDLSPNAWVAVRIWIDPAPVTAGPAGDILVTLANTDQAFCSGDNFAGLNSWVSAVIHSSSISLPNGVHSIRVERVGFGATSCRIDDTRLIVGN